MVNKYLYILGISILLIGCNQSSQIEHKTKNAEEANKISVIEKTKEEKDIADEKYIKSLEKLQISEEGFFLIAKHVIDIAKNDNFKEIDPILGVKERMYSKDFKDPYISYHYSHVPSYPGIEVYLKFSKEDNKLVMISLHKSGSAGGLSFKEYKLNTLEGLNLQVVKKELPNYSNQVFNYELTDNKFRYELFGKDNIDNKPPIEFYDFRIYLE